MTKSNQNLCLLLLKFIIQYKNTNNCMAHSLSALIIAMLIMQLG